MNIEQIKELSCGVNPEFISVNDWEEIITSLARRVIAAEALHDALKGMIKAYSEPDKQLCCGGHMCGCRGSSVRDYADYCAAEAIKAWEDAE